MYFREMEESAMVVRERARRMAGGRRMMKKERGNVMVFSCWKSLLRNSIVVISVLFLPKVYKEFVI